MAPQVFARWARVDHPPLPGTDPNIPGKRDDQVHTPIPDKAAGDQVAPCAGKIGDCVRGKRVPNKSGDQVWEGVPGKSSDWVPGCIW